MEITKALCLSTAHLSNPTRNALDAGTVGYATVWKAEWGFFIPCYAAPDAEDGNRLAEWPEDLLACRSAAMAADCEFMRFDVDGPFDDSLTDYSW